MPQPDDRWTIDELLVRYEFEPSIRDLFVEGNSDKAVIEWFLEEAGIKGVAVYEISSVNVPPDETRKLSLDENNRGRVIALAFELYSRGGIDLTTSVGCIADTDFDYLLGKEYECPLLIFTIFTSLELYLFDSRIVGKFLRLFVRNFRRDVERILGAFIPVLTELFLIRLANQELALRIEPIPFSKCCEVIGYKIDFDVQEYIRRYLSKGAKLREMARFTETIALYRGKLSGDARSYMHGHDFIELLIFYVTGFKKPKKAYQHDSFVRGLFSAIEPRYVDNQPLFIELKRRYG